MFNGSIFFLMSTIFATAEIVFFMHNIKTLKPLNIENWLIHQMETLAKLSIKWKL